MTRYKSVANTSVYADIGDLKNKIQKNKKSLKKVLTIIEVYNIIYLASRVINKLIMTRISTSRE